MTGVAPAQSSPCSIIDEIFVDGDQDAEPYTIELEVDTGVRLDVDRLRRAISRAAGMHARGCARLVQSAGPLGGGYRWEGRRSFDVDPVGVVPCATVEERSKARELLQSRRIPLREAPGWRVVVARGRRSDVVMLSVAHAVTDGVGVLRFVTSIARAYVGVPDPVASTEAWSGWLGRLGASSAASAWRASFFPGQAGRLSSFFERPARLARLGADEDGYVLHHVAVMPVPRAPAGATINDLLVTALVLAIQEWNHERGAPPGRIAVMVPVNLRPDEWRREGMANLTLPAIVSAAGGRSNGAARDLLDEIAGQTRRIKQDRPTMTGLQLYRYAGVFPAALRRIFPLPSLFLNLGGASLVPTAALSNLGRIEPVAFGRIPARALWFSPPVRSPLGLALGVLTIGDTMHLSLRARRGPMTTNGLAALGEKLLGTFALLGRQVRGSSSGKRRRARDAAPGL